MIEKEALKRIVYDQREKKKEKIIEREALPATLRHSHFITIITGIRRSGKSVLLNEIRKKNKERDYYLSFDDERLRPFRLEDFQVLHEVFIELFGEQNTFYFDEIQNVKGWELFIRRIYDKGNKVFITGSNANLLSRELGTRLTGRYVQEELFPFSFREYLRYLGESRINTYLTKDRAKIKGLFRSYLRGGGFPEYVATRNEDYLRTLYENILYRDVMVRYGILKEKTLLELAYFLISNVGKEVSYNKLRNMLGLANSITVKEYIEYIERTYLLSTVRMFDYSLRKQFYNLKKVYCIDNGLASITSFQFSSNRGRLLENLVFVELRRRGKGVYYHRDRHECDFVIKKGNRITEAIQVTWSLGYNNRDREVKGLLEAMDSYKLRKGLLLTYDQEEVIKEGRKTIIVKPVWEWLLE